MKRVLYITLILLLAVSCQQNPSEENKSPESKKSAFESAEKPFLWENANIYFMMTDRFSNGNKENDITLNRTKETAKLRGFMGGDIKGITQKINEGYFDKLGINTIWFTPVVEQISEIVDEGTGATYGFHGYWAKDWTTLDPNFGTLEELAELVETAHAHDIRILLDVVINHTGPVTDKDPVWPSDWVREKPKCDYKTLETSVSCALTDNLPDIRTESNKEVELPEFLKAKWESEGRLEQEIQELDEFFARTGYPRAPRFYIIKWLTDYIRMLGVDGFRVDTVKHTEASIWAELYAEAVKAFEDWKSEHPEAVMDNNEFYMVGEVYGYSISKMRIYDYDGDQEVDFFANGFWSLINFEFKSDAQKSYEEIFSKYSNILQDGLKGKSVVNYLTSHDDSTPFDKFRERPMESGTKLLLTPGASQVYYGDETQRSLDIQGTEGDATLRSFMNWGELETNKKKNGFETQAVLEHWQKLGRFRRDHVSVGAGIHEMVSESPYLFKRTFDNGSISDQVMVGLGLNSGQKIVDVSAAFENGAEIIDYYSGATSLVKMGRVSIDSKFGILLLAEK